MAGMTVSQELLTVPEAAAVAGVSVRTMRRWASSGQVRTTGTGHRRRVVTASLSEVVVTNGQIGQTVTRLTVWPISSAN
jgi:excisionase family DNA binding protein